MTTTLREFRGFALRGNLIELAVALVLALALKQLISSLVDHVLMPIVGIIFGEPSFNSLTIEINDSIIRYGSFLTNAIDFMIVSVAIFFLVVRPYNAIVERRALGEEDEDGPTPEPEKITLLRQIAENTARVG